MLILLFIFSSGLWWQSHRCEWNLLESSLPESPIQHIVRVRLEYRGLTSLTQYVSTHLFCDPWRHLIRASWQAPARRSIRITWRELSFSRGNGTCDNNGLTITDVTDDGQSHQVQFCGLVRTTTPFLCSELYFTLLFIRVSQVDRSSAPQLDLGRRARVVMKSDGQLSGRGFLLAFTAA